MAKDSDPVAKLRILVENPGGDPFILLSIKNSPGKDKHQKLEMPGGHLKPGETPLQALIRELAEEETTGFLSREVEEIEPSSIQVDAGGAVHHLFELHLSAREVDHLEPNPKESLGFTRIPVSSFQPGNERLTWRTKRILEALSD